MTHTATFYQRPEDKTQPYQVRTGCGHLVTRRMRPATAGVPYSADVVIEAPNGMVCDDCTSKHPGIDPGVWNHPTRVNRDA